MYPVQKKTVSQVVGGGMTLVPVYHVLLQYKNKQAITGSDEARNIGKVLLRKLRASGFRPKSYALCAWSSDYHAWWVYEVDDLRAFEATIRDLRYADKMDNWLDLQITIGTPNSAPPLSIDCDKMEIRADSADCATIIAKVVEALPDDKTTLTFTILEPSGALTLVRNGQEQNIDTGQVENGQVIAKVRSNKPGAINVLISTDGSREVGFVVPIQAINP